MIPIPVGFFSSGDVSVISLPGVGAITVTGRAPAANVDRAISPGTGAITITGRAPATGLGAIFAGGVRGAVFDFTNTATLFSDTGRTTLSTSGGAVKGVTDLSGNGNHLSTSASGFTRNATAGMDTTGTTPGMLTPGIGTVMGVNAAWTMVVACQFTNVSTLQRMTDLDSSPISSRVAQCFAVISTQVSVSTFGDGSAGGIVNMASAVNAVSNNTPFVVTSGRDTTSVYRLRINGLGSGTATTSSSGACSSGSVNTSLSVGAGQLGASGVSQSPATGRIFFAAVVNKTLTAAERDYLELLACTAAGVTWNGNSTAVPVGVGAGAITGRAPTVVRGTVVQPGVGSITTSGLAPTVV